MILNFNKIKIQAHYINQNKLSLTMIMIMRDANNLNDNKMRKNVLKGVYLAQLSFTNQLKQKINEYKR